MNFEPKIVEIIATGLINFTRASLYDRIQKKDDKIRDFTLSLVKTKEHLFKTRYILFFDKNSAEPVPKIDKKMKICHVINRDTEATSLINTVTIHCTDSSDPLFFNNLLQKIIKKELQVGNRRNVTLSHLPRLNLFKTSYSKLKAT